MVLEQSVLEQSIVEPSTITSRRFRILVPIANPDNVEALIDLAASIARPRDGEIVALRVAVVPEQSPPALVESNVEEERRILESARARALEHGVPINSQVRVGHHAARAILETLVARGALAVVTSHLGSLKTLDQPGSGIVNASLQFDGERMEPTYHLVKGRPGRSYGLAIARRMGLPSKLVDRAESFLSEEEAGLEDVLERLEARDAEAVELTALLEKERDHVIRLREELADREERLSRKEDSAEARAHEEARRLLMDARREVEEAIREVRSADGGEVDEASARARSRVERAAREHGKKAVRPDRPAAVAGDVGVGDRVAVMGSGAKGEVVELREGKATVAAGLMRIQVPVGELSLVAKAGASGEEAGREGPAGPIPRGGVGGWSGEALAGLQTATSPPSSAAPPSRLPQLASISERLPSARAAIRRVVCRRWSISPTL